jgi:hypothetical protein
MRPQRFRVQAAFLAGWLLGAALLVLSIVGASPAQAAAGAAASGNAPTAPTGHVVVIGIDGLQWSDVTEAGTPNLFRLAGSSSIASLVTRGESDYTCPADGWLTLNSGTRSTGGTVLRYPGGTSAATALITLPQQYCAPLPEPPPAAGPYDIPEFSAYTRPNNAYSYAPVFGSLVAPVAAAGGCVAASGPGALLGAADARGRVAAYLGAPQALTSIALSQCPLTLVDLGGVTDTPTAGPQPQPPVDRVYPYAALDSALGSLLDRIPAGSTVAVAGLDDSSQQAQLHAVLVRGPSFGGGTWLYAPSTRHAGLVQTLDLTPSLLRWTGLTPPQITAADPKPFTGSPISTRAGRPADPAGAIVVQAWLNTANQTFAQTNGRFVTWMAHAVAALAWAAGLVFAAVRWLPERYSPGRYGARRPALRRWRSGSVAVIVIWATGLAAVAPASFLANLVDWSATWAPGPILFGAMAVISLGLTAAVLTLCRRSSRLRDQPLAPAGVLGLLTLSIIALDVATGSRLQAQTPFGLSYVIAGRFYGIGNSAIGVYCVAAMVGSAWLASILLPRRGPGEIPPHVWPNTLREAAQGWLQRAAPGRLGLTRLPEAPRAARKRALLAVGAVGLAAIAACGYPGWGAKVGGTIAMVPGFVLLLLLVAGLRITWRRALAVAASGVVVVSGFALLNYLQPAGQRSHFGSFVASLFDGGWTGTIHRKIATNLASINNDWFSHYVPWILFWSLLAVVAPRLVGARSLAWVYAREPFVRCALWLALLTVALGWFVDDSGILVPKMALFLAAPLGVLSAALTLLPQAAGHDAQPAAVPSAWASEGSSNPSTAAEPPSGGDSSGTSQASATHDLPGSGHVANQSAGDQ